MLIPLVREMHKKNWIPTSKTAVNPIRIYNPNDDKNCMNN